LTKFNNLAEIIRFLLTDEMFGHKLDSYVKQLMVKLYLPLDLTSDY